MKNPIFNLTPFYISLFAILFIVASRTSFSQEINPPKGFYDSLWVSPSGDMALFMYSRCNFFPTILGGEKPVLTAGSLPSHHNNDDNPWDDSDLYFIYKNNAGVWSAPINMPTNDHKADCCAMIAEHELFLQKETDLYLAEYKNNKWSAALKLLINSPAIDSNPHFDKETQTLYWASNRSGNFDIWQSSRNQKTHLWSPAKKVPG